MLVAGRLSERGASFDKKPPAGAGGLRAEARSELLADHYRHLAHSMPLPLDLGLEAMRLEGFDRPGPDARIRQSSEESVSCEMTRACRSLAVHEF